MQKSQTDSFSLEKIFEKYGIRIISDWDGQPRDFIDIIEEMYFKLSPRSITKLFMEIGEEEEKFGNSIFKKEREKWNSH